MLRACAAIFAAINRPYVRRLGGTRPIEAIHHAIVRAIDEGPLFRRNCWRRHVVVDWANAGTDRNSPTINSAAAATIVTPRYRFDGRFLRPQSAPINATPSPVDLLRRHVGDLILGVEPQQPRYAGCRIDLEHQAQPASFSMSRHRESLLPDSVRKALDRITPVLRAAPNVVACTVHDGVKVGVLAREAVEVLLE